jgi:hypothetical protein
LLVSRDGLLDALRQLLFAHKGDLSLRAFEMEFELEDASLQLRALRAKLSGLGAAAFCVLHIVASGNALRKCPNQLVRLLEQHN